MDTGIVSRSSGLFRTVLRGTHEQCAYTHILSLQRFDGLSEIQAANIIIRHQVNTYVPCGCKRAERCSYTFGGRGIQIVEVADL